MSGRERIYLFDTTLRDGAQTNGVDFTLHDKLAIAATARRPRRRLHRGRLSRREPDRHRAVRRGARPARDPHRLRHDAAAGPLGGERSRPRRPSSTPAPTRSASSPSRRSITSRSRSETTLPSDRSRPRSARACAGRRREGQGGPAHLRALLRRLQSQSGLCARRANRRRTTRAPGLSVLCDTNGGALPNEIVEIVGAVVKEVAGRSASTPQRHRVGGRKLLVAVRAGATTDPGDSQRPRRTLRQRQYHFADRQSQTQARLFRALRDRHR